MTQIDLEQLIRDTESDRLEKTVSTTDTAKFSEAVCAFANDMGNHRKPGYLLVGVNDNNTIAGMQITDEFLRTLSDLRSAGNILPQPAMTVEKVVMPAGEVAVVTVQPSDLPPLRYKGKVHIRVGPRKAVANEQEERMLAERRSVLAKTFDATPCPDAKVGDLSIPSFVAYRQQAVAPDVIEANHRDLETQLASLRFFNSTINRPTNAGLILFGKNPRFFLPGNYIQFLRFPGNSITDVPSDQAEISGDLSTVIRELELRLKAIITTGLSKVSSLQENLQPDYPEWAIRELLMNAIMHRDYSSNSPIKFYVFDDRIEIHNPGGLFGESNPGNFPDVNAYRNPTIAEALKTLGYVNRYGYGVKRAKALLKENGNPDPEFKITESGTFAVIIPKRKKA
ncbi:MAG: putative DNA binding domain-containing protein [Saprospirales bacterium]|nr:putative DNA binding domain-containing protein [Saprospirales bacterium]